MVRLKYNQGDGIIEIIIRDETMRKEESFKANLSDNKEISRIARLLKSKYNVDLYADIKDDTGFFDF